MPMLSGIQRPICSKPMDLPGYFFSPAVQLISTVSGVPAVCSVCNRNEEPPVQTDVETNLGATWG